MLRQVSGKSGPLRGGLPLLLVFAASVLVHFFWVTAISPEIDASASSWAALPSEDGPAEWLASYLAGGGYYLGYSYGLSFAFAVWAIRAHLRRRSARSKGFAVAGVSFFGFIAAAGCFMIGCCGSPMLIVWLNLFGAGFLPFAKPLLAGLTTLSIIGAYLWMERKNSGITLEIEADKSS
ncbi:hypothetical protein EPN96_02450 [bacterium]|nr:MAG: hypothetical protein EPN96_02450 [bacterium]